MWIAAMLAVEGGAAAAERGRPARVPARPVGEAGWGVSCKLVADKACSIITCYFSIYKYYRAAGVTAKNVSPEGGLLLEGLPEGNNPPKGDTFWLSSLLPCNIRFIIPKNNATMLIWCHERYSCSASGLQFLNVNRAVDSQK